MAADVQCPVCGVKRYILCDSRYICPCGHTGKVADDTKEQ